MNFNFLKLLSFLWFEVNLFYYLQWHLTTQEEVSLSLISPKMLSALSLWFIKYVVLYRKKSTPKIKKGKVWDAILASYYSICVV